MPTCYQTAAAMMKTGNASWLLCNNEESQSDISIPIKKHARAGRQAGFTHRDVKELLRVVQHTDPNGDVPSRGHGRGSVPRVQRADAKSLRGPETLPRSRGYWLWVWLCHDALRCSLPSLHRRWERKVRETNTCMCSEHAAWTQNKANGELQNCIWEVSISSAAGETQWMHQGPRGEAARPSVSH